MSTVVDFSRLHKVGSLSAEELLRHLETQREQELNEARAIQLGMMPRGTLETGDVTVCYDFQPFHEVGGDFLDFFQLSDQKIGIYLGDVTGKGLPAALYAALAVGTLRGVHKTGTDPAAVLSQLNRRMLLHNISHRYAAVEYACFDPSTGVLRIVSAGMEGPLHVMAGGCHEMALQGLPPGMFLSATYESITLRLQRGDSIVFFSDGLSDTRNHAGNFFGTERIREVCNSMLRATPQEQLNAITTSVMHHADGETQQDDRTIAILHYKPSWRTGNESRNSN